jgi:hypothetical protein
VFEVLERITRLAVEGYRADLPSGGKVEGTPLFIDAEDVGLAGAIRGLADTRPAQRSSPAQRSPGPPVSPTSALTAAAPSPQAASRISAPAAQAGEADGHPSNATAARAPTPPVAADHFTTPAPVEVTAPFSLSELWPASDRDAVRRAEQALAARDGAGAVLACEDLLSRILAAGSLLLGGQGANGRDPATVALLLGLEGNRYLAFRLSTRAVRAKRAPGLNEALECYVFVVQARQALDRAATAAPGKV